MGNMKEAKTLRYSDEYNHVFQLEHALVDSQSSPLRPADFSYVGMGRGGVVLCGFL
jgi:hypothetical protein